MTLVFNRNPAFAAIRGIGAQTGNNGFWALGGISNKILLAKKQSGVMTFVNESEDLGAEILAVNTETTPNCHVLTKNGLTRLSNDANLDIISQHSFDPGDGTWLHLFGGTFLATPLKRGGVQVVNATTGVQVSTIKVAADSRYSAAYTFFDWFWVVDTITAKIHGFVVSESTGQLTYVGKVDAPNCRDVIKVVLDEDNGNLFVVCRRRIVRFTVPTSSVTDLDDMLPVFAEDYGTSTVDYVDFVVVDENQYWISADSASSPTPLDAYYGPLYGAWDSTEGENGELYVAAPKHGIWTVSNVIPVYDEDTIIVPTETPEEPPIVVTPDPPVITSSLSVAGVESDAYSYTITATGTGPITYSLVNPPVWVGAVGGLTGITSGMYPTPGSYNLTIAATNAGGTTTATVVFTIASAIGDNTDTYTNGTVQDAYIDTSTGVLLAYMVGTFTSVTDRNGTYTRSNGACLNMTTGLWTAWDAKCSTTVYRVERHSDGYIYMASQSGTSSWTSGTVVGFVARVDATTGNADAAFAPVFDTTPRVLHSSGSTLYVGGTFQTVNGQPRAAACSFTGTTLNSFRIQSADGSPTYIVNHVGGPGGIETVAVVGGTLVFAGGTCRLIRPAGGNYVTIAGAANVTTGVAAQSANGPGVANYQEVRSTSRDYTNGVLALVRDGAAGGAIRQLPNGTPDTGLDLYVLVRFSSTGGIATVGGNIAQSGGANMYGAVETTTSDRVIVAGLFSSLSSNTNARTFAAVNYTSGSLDTSFSYHTRLNATAQGAGGTGFSVRRIRSGATLLMGNIGNSIGTHTHDGKRFCGFIVANDTTGARL